MIHKIFNLEELKKEVCEIINDMSLIYTNKQTQFYINGYLNGLTKCKSVREIDRKEINKYVEELFKK